jgi:hypothetical protein
MARRILNRKEMRADYDAAERRNQDDEHGELEGDAVEQDGDEVEADEHEASAGDEPDEEAPKKRKPAAKGTKTPSRSRAAKVTRMKVVWGVFNNVNQRVAVFDYAKRQEADELAAQLKADKKMTHFVQPVKEPMEG